MAAELRLTRRTALAGLAGLGGLALAGCNDPAAKARSVIDATWHRQDLIDNLLSRWLAKSPQPNGSFHTAFDRAWNPLPQPELELTLQCRLIYAMTIGHEVTKDARYLEAARHGADFLLANFHDRDFGGFLYSVAPDGKPMGSVKRAYGHAFALLALAELYRVGQDARYRDAALKALGDIQGAFFERSGGLANECGRDMKPMAGGHTQNPVMHMFEALLALHEATGDKTAQAAARRLGDFTVYQLLQGLPEASGGGARIPEWYDAGWKALPNKDAGGYIELGHQFEWTHLLTTGASVQPVYAQVSERVMAYALAAGYDEIDGGCLGRTFPDDAKPDKTKGWWQQAECLHALMVAAQATGRNDLWRRYEQTTGYIKEQLIDRDHGGWRAADELPCKSGRCKDEQPDPYHMTRLHHAALKLSGALGPAAP